MSLGQLVTFIFLVLLTAFQSSLALQWANLSRALDCFSVISALKRWARAHSVQFPKEWFNQKGDIYWVLRSNAYHFHRKRRSQYVVYSVNKITIHLFNICTEYERGPRVSTRVVPETVYILLPQIIQLNLAIRWLQVTWESYRPCPKMIALCLVFTVLCKTEQLYRSGLLTTFYLLDVHNA